MRCKNTLLAGGLMTLLLVSLSGHAQETEWEKTHPRRAEVNSRLANQDKRIKHDVKDGTMSHAEAKNLHAQDHAIRKQEQADASAHNGHITRKEQKRLNQEENTVSHEISAN